MDSQPGPALRTLSVRAGSLMVRVSPDDTVLYANRALAEYVRASKEDLVGTPLEVLAGRCTGEVAACFARSETGRRGNALVTDADGRVFEAKSVSEGGVLDIVLDEVTTPDSIAGPLVGATGTPVEHLDEDELRTVRQPERRYLTVSFTRMWDVASLAGKLPPMDLRVMIDACLEEAAEAIADCGCTVGASAGASVAGIFGAPRHFLDHPLRAVRAACETVRRSGVLHAGFALQGKEMPPCSIGLWTGEALVGVFGAGPARHYAALGAPLELAERLGKLSRPGEVLLPEHTLTHLLRVLPEEWTHLRAESETEHDLSDFCWSGEEIYPVPEHLRRVVYLVGPGVEDDPARAEYYFDYLWALRVRGREAPVPILRAARPSALSDPFELRSDNVLVGSPAEVLGKYRLLEVVGTGGMGRVWRGVDRFGNNVAIKVLHSHDGLSDAQIRRFRREAEIMARLQHRNICRVFEMNEFEGIQYIAMEFIDGLSLADILYSNSAHSSASGGPVDLATLIRSIRSERLSQEPAEAAPEAAADHAAPDEQAPEAPPVDAGFSRPRETRILPVQQTLSIILRVSEAIQFAHEHGVLHRDLKPGNILLREDGEPLVVDFGLAKLAGGDPDQSVSVSGHVVGTLENMPPEQAESSKEVDERADVYALGTILYQMLTGRRHFVTTGNLVADAQALKTHEPARLRAFNRKLDSDLEIITLKALRNDPGQRYPSVAALRADLERYQRGEPISAKPVSAIELVRRLVIRNRAVTAVAAVSLAAIVATVALALWGLSQQLSREQAARGEAETARREAEQHKAVAEERQREAEAKQRLADEQRVRAESLLKAKEESDLAAAAARASSERAAAETQAERERRLVAEQRAEEQESQLANTREDLARLEAAKRAPPPQPEPPEDPAAIHAARRAMAEAVTILNFELSPFEIERLERNPERVIERLARAIGQASRGLVADPQFGPGWMLKGRLHMAALEFPAAARSFGRAADLGGGGEGDGDAESLRLAADLAGRAGAKPLAAADALDASGSAMDRAAAGVLRYLVGKSLPRGSANTPTGRIIAAPEIALDLMLANGLDAAPSVETDNGGRIEVSMAGAARDLSPLRAVGVASLAIRGTRDIDWETVVALDLERFDLAGCPVEALPTASRAFLRLRDLNLSGTRVVSIEAGRQMPQLERLNLANADILDLSPLLGCRRLRFLDLSGSDRIAVAILLNLPLESLTISPLLISDKAGLNALRRHRTLRTLRTPDDPDPQPPAAFWAKLDAGAYDTSPAP